MRDAAWARLLGAKPPAWVPPHCRAVEALAMAMCACAARAGRVVDPQVVSCGALLHDIGRSVTQDVRHAVVGADLLRADHQWPDAIVSCVERHTGAGIEPDEARELGLPVRDYTPRTLEERIVAHADNLYSGSKRLRLDDLRAKYEAKGLPVALARIERLHDALCRELEADLETLAPADLPPLPA